VLLLTGRAEAGRLARSPLVLAGLAITAAFIWLNHRTLVPLWWTADVGIGSALLAPAGCLLVAAQLAAGRTRRDGMTELYASYPAGAAAQTGGLLLGIAGPVLLAAVLTAAAVGWLDAIGTTGSPRLWVLAGGLLLVALGGCLGVALGSWRAHPMAGILAVIVIGVLELDVLLSVTEPLHLPGGLTWLFPWSQAGGVLAYLPGRSVPYPPPAHLAELAGLILLACAAALARPLSRRRAVAIVAAVSLAVTAWGCWRQAPGVPESRLAALVRQATQPQRYQHCRATGGVRYCYYPGFGALVSRWAAPVAGVTGRVPTLAGRMLTVRQVDDQDFLIYPLAPVASLTSNGPSLTTPVTGILNRFQAALATNPHLIPGSANPPVYTDESWGLRGTALRASQLGLALGTAFWVTRLPTTAPSVLVHGSDGAAGTFSVPCLAVGQAREAIALWLAGAATPVTRAAFGSLLADPSPSLVGRHWISSYDVASAGPSFLWITAQGAALARQMMRLPDRLVEAVLRARWPGWLSPAATDAQLAAALGVPLPSVPAQTGLTGDPGNPPMPRSPVCR
jgi:hypothetical protein